MSREQFISYVQESDARTDPNLDLYRVETQAMKRLATTADRAFLAVGLKGVGKTACFKSLSAGRDVDFVQAISAGTQEPLNIEGSRPTLQFVEDIRSELVMQALNTLVEKLKTDKKLAKKVPDDLHQEAQVLVTKLWKRLKDAFGNLGGITILGFGISFRNRQQQDTGLRLVPRDEYTKAFSIVERLSKSIDFRIVVDDPESVFAADEGLNENLVAALAIAAHELQTRLTNFKCIVLMKPNVFRALRRVDEFVNLPPNGRVRLSWTEEELKDVIRLRAKAAQIDLATAFKTDPEPALDAIVKDCRSGPRDALRRLELHFDAHLDEPVTPETLEKTIDSYSEACFEQMYGAYERQYRGLSRAAIVLFEGPSASVPKVNVRNRLDSMIGSSKEILAFKDESWARDATLFADLLVQFGLVAIQTANSIVLPYHAHYPEEAAKSDAVFTLIPGLRGRANIAAARTKPVTERRKGR
ncbi:hypothetical protein CCGE525_24085 (plasmid) [Rhizobium jaguaris]|uniref:Uncharacterized protein n=1 Tax=Rhizobium jaguaris TaxID=1312183 RepID=A0A387G1Q1_9HYPH|nr:hypothetical protein CCGE525_24085 [Rhizobium jaguaris]